MKALESAFWNEDPYTLSMRVLDDAKARFLDLLDGAIWEDALFLSVFENALDRAIRESKTKES